MLVRSCRGALARKVASDGAHLEYPCRLDRRAPPAAPRERGTPHSEAVSDSHVYLEERFAAEPRLGDLRAVGMTVTSAAVTTRPERNVTRQRGVNLDLMGILLFSLPVL